MELPGPIKDGIRVGLSLVLFECLGLLVGSKSLLGRTFQGDCTWAAVTIAVISAPLVGKITQTGFQRIVGSIIGEGRHACMGCMGLKIIHTHGHMGCMVTQVIQSHRAHMGTAWG